jgi:Zn finger protein HypA/HybF involved in hydrogenase expression
MKLRYTLECEQCGTIEADMSDDGLFDRPTAERRAGFHEGSRGHDVSVEIAQETNEYRCPVCHRKCVGERERDKHAKTEPGVSPDSFVRL